MHRTDIGTGRSEGGSKRDKRQKAGKKSTPDVRNGRRSGMGKNAEKMGRSSYIIKIGECVLMTKK